MSTTNGLDPALKAMIGLTNPPRRYKVTDRDIFQFRQAIGDFSENDEHRSSIETHSSEAMLAPPLFCQTFCFEEKPQSELLPDGSPSELDIPIPAQRTVGGGSSFKIYKRVKSGDTITVTSKLKDVYTKEGRSGLLYFIIVETHFTDQDDCPLATETATYIKRM